MNILAIGAHWDDIELGCGLTLKKMADQGHKIFTVVVFLFMERILMKEWLRKMHIKVWY